jgi:hypothetical protein
MAAIIRSAKAESDWTANDLQAYNVIVVDEDVAAFFGDTQLPPPPVRQAILTSVDYPENGLPDKEDRLFFSYMRYAMLRAKPGEESLVGDFVGDFTRHLLSMLHYDDYDRVTRWNAYMPLFMCGSNVDTQADIYVAEQDGTAIVLLVLEDNTHQKMGDPEARLFAKAVAAFQFQNKRLRNAGLPPINTKVFPRHHHGRDCSYILQDRHHVCCSGSHRNRSASRPGRHNAQTGSSHSTTWTVARRRHEAVG